MQNGTPKTKETHPDYKDKSTARFRETTQTQRRESLTSQLLAQGVAPVKAESSTQFSPCPLKTASIRKTAEPNPATFGRSGRKPGQSSFSEIGAPDLVIRPIRTDAGKMTGGKGHRSSLPQTPLMRDAACDTGANKLTTQNPTQAV